MAQRVVPVLILAFSFLFFPLLSGCSKDRITGERWGSRPETELTYAPLETDTTSFSVHLYWTGYDNDGEVVLFRYAIDADTLNSPAQWHTTTGHDSVFSFSVDPISHVQSHAFWVIAQDNDGYFDPTPAKRAFSSKTVPPTSTIIRGPLNGTVTGGDVTFGWEGSDPDGNPGGWALPVESFEYILLQPGQSASLGHPPLPLDIPLMKYYPDLINRSSATSLPPPYDDWAWVRTTETSHRFTGLIQGNYVIAVRAVDRSGARETNLKDYTNIRWFFGGLPAPPGPDLIVTSNVLLDEVRAPGAVVGKPIREPLFVPPIQIMSSQVVSFAWRAQTSTTGAPIRGFTYALDDTTTEDWSDVDARKVTVTLPTGMSEGPHFLFVRAVDVDNGSTVFIFRLFVVRPEFRDGPPRALCVDDFTAPGGNPLAGATPNYPADTVDDDWWRRVLMAPLSQEFGVTLEEWDTYRRQEGFLGRGCPKLQDLAQYRVVIWSVDFNNTLSSPTGLWRTTVGGPSSDLANYVRGGGTLIVTGFILANNVTSPPSMPYFNFTSGMCATLQPGSAAHRFAYFTRGFIGIDAARSSDEATRTNGARDFVEARVTSAGQAMGFETAAVDSGAGEKWDPYVLPGPADVSLAPGLPKVEGWKMQADFGCGLQGMRVENPSAPVAVPLFTYHGVNQGLLQNGQPSKREDMVIGVATQAHDLGESDGRPVTAGDTRGVMGRMVFLGFPIYYVKDNHALAVMRAAFSYVNGSPTLEAGSSQATFPLAKPAPSRR
jgi:hypothetical protein